MGTTQRQMRVRAYRGQIPCLKPRIFHDQPLRTLVDVEFATMAWVDGYNNRRRRQVTLGRLTPTEYETAHYAALNLEPQPVCDRQKTRDGSNSHTRH